MSRVDWQFFGTLTFKKERVPTAVRIKLWFALARALAKWYGVYFPNLLWVLRAEQGEVTGRTHFHCLIGGISVPILVPQRQLVTEAATFT